MSVYWVERHGGISVTETSATFVLAARIFWSILWRSFAIGIPIIFFTGMTTAGLFSSLGNDGANTAARVATLLVMIPVQIFCIQLVIGKTFGKYKLALLSTSADADQQSIRADVSGVA
jgi:hypothetical protein